MRTVRKSGARKGGGAVFNSTRLIYSSKLYITIYTWWKINTKQICKAVQPYCCLKYRRATYQKWHESWCPCHAQDCPILDPNLPIKMSPAQSNKKERRQSMPRVACWIFSELSFPIPLFALLLQLSPRPSIPILQRLPHTLAHTQNRHCILSPLPPSNSPQHTSQPTPIIPFLT